MIPCKECGREISQAAKSCPGCGAPNVRPGMSAWPFFIILGLVAAMGFIATRSNNVSQDSEISHERRAIAYCWETHDKQSLGNADKRFIAGACEKMESDFREKWRSNP